MFIDINTIGPEGLAFDRSLRLHGLEGPSRESIPDVQARVAGIVTPTGDGADLKARLETTVPLTCGRCLETFSWDVRSSFDLAVVRHSPEADALPSDAGDQSSEIVVAHEGRIELEALATEQLYLNLPLKPICSPGCQGLCPTCGMNRNTGSCGCVSEDVDPRLAPLLPFRRKMQDS